MVENLKKVKKKEGIMINRGVFICLSEGTYHFFFFFYLYAKIKHLSIFFSKDNYIFI